MHGSPLKQLAILYLLMLCLFATVVTKAQDNAAPVPQAVRGVIVLVHGISSGPEEYTRFKERVWEKALPDTALVEFNWSNEAFFHASGSIGERANFAVGMNNRAWGDGVSG
ncbi:MAG TPA: hypothetical protein VHV83_19915, partial [Armatimonadota bacterium]|nr:hypothetical protein [Armatimonadota bacterium]